MDPELIPADVNLRDLDKCSGFSFGENSISGFGRSLLLSQKFPSSIVTFENDNGVDGELDGFRLLLLLDKFSEFLGPKMISLEIYSLPKIKKKKIRNVVKEKKEKKYQNTKMRRFYYFEWGKTSFSRGTRVHF